MPRPSTRALTAVGLVALVVAVGALTLRKRPGADSVVTVDGKVRHQTIDGWATNFRRWEEDKGQDRYDQSADLYGDLVGRFLADSVGINAARLEIFSGMENRSNRWRRFRDGQIGYREWQKTRFEKINDNPDPNQADTTGFLFDQFDRQVETGLLPLKRAVEARGEKLFINVNYVDFRWNATNAQGTLNHAEQPEEFAEFVLVYFRRLRDKYGITPDAFEVILEPENTQSWRGRTIGQGILSVSKRLADQGFAPEIIAPSNTSMSNAIEYFDEMMKVPGVDTRVKNFAYHRYGLERLSDVKAIRARADKYGLKTSMLEKVDAGIDVLLEDLTVGNVSAWQQWGAAGKSTNRDNGGYYARVDVSDAANIKITRARLTGQLAQLFRFVRRDAVRIESRSDNSDKRTAAFINRDGRWVVVVRAKQAGGTISIEGLPTGRYGLRFVDDAGAARELPTVTTANGGPATATLPGPGVLTVCGVVCGTAAAGPARR